MLPTKPIRSNTISKHFVHTVDFLSEQMMPPYSLCVCPYQPGSYLKGLPPPLCLPKSLDCDSFLFLLNSIVRHKFGDGDIDTYTNTVSENSHELYEAVILENFTIAPMVNNLLCMKAYHWALFWASLLKHLRITSL
jgi:hypothetical protein